MAQSGMPDTTTGGSWETLPYLDRVWRLPQLPWAARTRLLEMHQAGVLEEGDLSLAALRSLNISGHGGEVMEKVLLDFWDLATSGQHSIPGTAGAARTANAAGTAGAAEQGTLRPAQPQHSPGWKNDTLLELLRGRRVRQWWPAVALSQLDTLWHSLVRIVVA
jgi:hypothetical protein